MKTYMKCADPLHAQGGPEQVIILIDESASMEDDDYKPNRLHAAKEAGCALIAAKLRHHAMDHIGVVGFSEDARIIHSVATVERSAGSLERALRSVRARTLTNVGSGLEIAERLLGHHGPGGRGGGIFGTLRRWILAEGGSPPSEPPGNSRIILLSDGGDTSDSSPRLVATRLKARGVVIDCIGIGGSPDEVDEDTLRDIASARPDGSKRYCFIKDSEQLVQKFESLAGRLRPLEA